MYLIERIICVSGDNKAIYSMKLQTNDIEKTRKELLYMYRCERIYFVYSES